MALSTKGAERSASAKSAGEIAQSLANNPAAFSIKTGRIGAFARTAAGEAIDLDVRRAQVVQGQRSALLDDGEEMYLSGAASSTVEDRMGDTLDSTCQASMLSQARGMTQFLDHVYTLPENILGTCVEPSLAMATDSKQGDCLDLNIVARVASENPRAVKCWQHVQNGVKLGWSIGGIFTDVDFKDEDDWFSGLIVHDIELLEISLVGVPANPRTYTKFISEMTKGFKSNLATVAKSLDESDRKRPEVGSLVRKSLLGGIRPEDIRLNTRATGTREDANDDKTGNTAPENPNATPTRDRPVRPEDSPTAGAHPTVGPPNADEPLAVPQVGSPHVTGAQSGSPQPQENNPVSPSNAAPEPARLHGDGTDGHQGGPDDHFPSRPDQHAQQGVADATSGAEVTSQIAKPQAGQAGAAVDEGGSRDGGQYKPIADAASSSAPADIAKPTSGQGTKSFKDVGDGDEVAAIIPDGGEGDKLRRKAVKSMRAMKRALAPGMHSESATHLRKAHAAVKSMVGNDYELPGDALLDDDGVSDSAQRSLPAMETKKAELDREISAKQSEVKNLDDKLAELRATPTGRRSAYPGGSIHNESEPMVSAEAYYVSPHEQTKALNRQVAGVGADARDQA